MESVLEESVRKVPAGCFRLVIKQADGNFLIENYYSRTAAINHATKGSYVINSAGEVIFPE
ncbi:MAG: hypothetical protein KKE50_02555 [Nanoarchaeota archaeon]|nr:hypothetical protein [Nanoarchaeota archaeon]